MGQALTLRMRRPVWVYRWTTVDGNLWVEQVAGAQRWMAANPQLVSGWVGCSDGTLMRVAFQHSNHRWRVEWVSGQWSVFEEGPDGFYLRTAIALQWVVAGASAIRCLPANDE